MENSCVYPEDFDLKTTGFDTAIEVLVVALLLFMPLAFGAVEAWSEQVVVVLAGAIAVCFTLKIIFHRDTAFVWSWAYLPVAMFILVVVLQLLPLPTAFVGVISPNTVSVKTQLYSQLPDTETLLNPMTISFYPNAALHDLRIVLAIASLFVVVLNTYRQPEKIKRLLVAIAVIGGMVALLAMAQDLFGNGKVYWTIPCYDKAFSGPFMHHSHYGQFMNLSVGACLALLLVSLHETFAGRKITPSAVFEYFNSSPARLVWLLVAIIILGITTIFLSLTRGGVVSMLVAGGFMTVILASRRPLKGAGWIMALVAVLAFVCILYIGFDAVYDRLATLRDLREAQAGRFQILSDIAVAWKKFPVFGTGLGTHEVVYPMFDRSTIPELAAHADNEYAQALEETGLSGLMLLVLFAVIMFSACINIIRHGRLPISSAAYGLGFALLAILIHSLSDFGQHLPANASLSAVFCALLLAIDRMERQDVKAEVTSSLPARTSQPMCILAAVAVTAVWLWSLSGANAARVAEGYWKKALSSDAVLRKNDWQGSNEQYAELIKNAAAAVDKQPQDVKYRYWLNVYRWYAVSRFTDPATGRTVLHKPAVEFVGRIVEHLHRTIALCPTFGPAWYTAGQLEKFVLDDPAGAEHIRTGFWLAPCDALACFTAGLLDANEEKFDESIKKFQRAVELDGSFFRDVAQIYIDRLNRPDLALAVAADNIDRLSQVADKLATIEEHSQLATQLRSRVVELLRARCQLPDAPAGAFASLAGIYMKQRINDDAVQCYRRALDLDYGQVGWRFNLAKLLAEQKRFDEAVHEARICLRINPQFEPAEKLIADLTLRTPFSMKE